MTFRIKHPTRITTSRIVYGREGKLHVLVLMKQGVVGWSWILWPFPLRRLRKIIPYRVRLWWAFRDAAVCACDDPAKGPMWHDKSCPVYEEWDETMRYD